MVSVCTVPAREGRSCEHFGGYKTINRIPLPLMSLELGLAFDPVSTLLSAPIIELYHTLLLCVSVIRNQSGDNLAQAVVQREIKS